MSYTTSSCDCSGGTFFYTVTQCKGCSNCDCNIPFGSSNANQRRIWKSARVDSSLYTMNLAALTVLDSQNNSAGLQAKGVGVKHNSYARYLAKLKGEAVQTIKPSSDLTPQTGNKKYVFGIVSNCSRDCGAQ